MTSKRRVLLGSLVVLAVFGLVLVRCRKTAPATTAKLTAETPPTAPKPEPATNPTPAPEANPNSAVPVPVTAPKRPVHPYARLLFVAALLAALLGGRGPLDTWLQGKTKTCTKQWAKPWLSQAIYVYDAIVAVVIVRGVISPGLNQIAIGMGGWYASSRGTRPDGSYYYQALSAWVPSVWLWLALTAGVICAAKMGEKTNNCDKHYWNNMSLLMVWVVLALVTLVLISTVGATRQWGREHPAKPEIKPAPVVAPVKPNPQPKQSRRPDVPSRDILGGEAFTVFPHGQQQEPNAGGIFDHNTGRDAEAENNGDRSANK